jgi:hypothetical protein
VDVKSSAGSKEGKSRQGNAHSEDIKGTKNDKTRWNSKDSASGEDGKNKRVEEAVATAVAETVGLGGAAAGTTRAARTARAGTEGHVSRSFIAY